MVSQSARLGALCLAALVMVGRVHGATLYTETFEGGAGGWGDRDAGSGMDVTHEASVGSPASGAMQGEFGLQVFPLPQTDAFKISTGTDFLGDYTGLTGFTLDLYADQILPSDAALRIVSGLDTFFYTLNLGSMIVDEWKTFTVSLTYSSGWQGGEAAFNNALLNVGQVELQLTRNGTAQQFFYLDNVGTLDTQIDGGGGGSSAVPEASTVSIFVMFGVLMYALRRYVNLSFGDPEEETAST